MKSAIVESVIDQYAAEVREAYSALREAEVQVEKSEQRAEAARKAAELRRMDLGRALLRARSAWPERGPKAKGWGDFLEKEGIAQATAWRYMEMAGGKVSFTDSRLNEIPHPSEISESDPSEQPSPARKPYGQLIDLPLYLGRWEDVLSDAGKVDALITDPPYSERVHKSKATRNDGVDPDGLAPSFAHWTQENVQAFVDHWAPRTRGWMLCLCDDEMIPWYRAAYERVGRVSFAPVPCVITGMTVRTRGDGPSSWAVYAMVGRPATAEFAKWGTLPGAYVGPREEGAGNGRGKPRWLTDAFVKDYSRQSDLVCDPLAGYGGTLISSLLLGRRALGAEMDEEAVDKAFANAGATQQQA